MEKYSQFRDKGTAIAPFLPVPTPQASVLWTPIHVLLFLVRLPTLIFLSIFYFSFLEWLPVGTFVKTCVLWVLLAVPGVWWVDLQVDGVKRGGIDAQRHLPQAGTIIASSFTSPLDPLYLAGIFCPIFTRSYPGTKKVEPISLFRAILLAFSSPTVSPSNPSALVTLKALHAKYPDAIICVFPECTTTNGRGILPFSPSLLTADPKTKIFPVNVRYTPGDVTTPVPGNYISWFWKLLSKPTHTMRVRIAHRIFNNPSLDTPSSSIFNNQDGVRVDELDMGYDTNIFNSPHMRNGIKQGNAEKEGSRVSADEQKVLDRVGEDLARLGRVKRVGLGVQEKISFLKVWSSRRR
ncbi:hypothetical protein K491DRAFT_691274 [Lophiostoma macrostomum CBS 122681]|uniref:Phospholipid/glycerol acyltransferase domain-containing protein n=1 Tax=Lophiostoma macrostomum CBS 122681 TaxID=1314788 RepID=A0A6A6TBQ9_9PLEO|nr:hypothetical protein K491DRAFT_691274 [Lophiostoma macrostomum CBS 122681]